MPRIRNFAFDCADPYALAHFWAQVMGHAVDADSQPGDEEVGIRLPNSQALYFQRVPEPKSVKNRAHICLEPDSLRDADVERILGLGGAFVADHRNPDGTGWVVLADPEGNEFCVLRSAAERTAAHQ
jgi:predicted enzyme related to lactoylglutathione lyase